MNHSDHFSSSNDEPVIVERLRRRLIGECDSLTVSKSLILKRKTWHPRYYTNEDALKLAAISKGISIRHAQLSLLESCKLRWNAKFNPDQPRVPAGQREGGQWTSIGGGMPAAGSVRHVDISSKPVDIHGPFGIARSALGSEVLPVGSKSLVTIDYSRALTGISTIDAATKVLSETLAGTMERVDFIPGWTPQIYGTAVHVDFANQVRNLGYRGIDPRDVEQSFNFGKTADYGEPGSIRTDIVLRNDIGDIIAIYDVKTGGAYLTDVRVRQLREKTGVGPEVPIFEMQVKRGVTIKGQSEVRGPIGSITALMWNPIHQGSVGRMASA